MPAATEPFGGRTYFGGAYAANARRTAFRDTASLRTIALIGISSDLCSLRIFT